MSPASKASENRTKNAGCLGLKNHRQLFRLKPGYLSFFTRVAANRMFYAITALAYNLMKAVQIRCLPQECQSWAVPTLLKQMVRIPATLVRHSRRLVTRVEVAVSWLNWWRSWEERWWRAGEQRSLQKTAAIDRFHLLANCFMALIDQSSIFIPFLRKIGAQILRRFPPKIFIRSFFGMSASRTFPSSVA